MGSFTRLRKGNLRLICARNEMNARMGLLRSLAVRSALPSIFSGAVFSPRDQTPFGQAMRRETLFPRAGVSAGRSRVRSHPPRWERGKAGAGGRGSGHPTRTKLCFDGATRAGDGCTRRVTELGGRVGSPTEFKNEGKPPPRVTPANGHHRRRGGHRAAGERPERGDRRAERGRGKYGEQRMHVVLRRHWLRLACGPDLLGLREPAGGGGGANQGPVFS